MNDQPNADPEEFLKSLVGIEFPTSKAALVRTAQDKGGFDTEVMHVLQQLPDRSYSDESELLLEVRRVYAAGGGLGDAGPAAPTDASELEKEVIKTHADPRRGESS